MINKNNMVEQATPQQKKVPIQFYLTEDMKKRFENVLCCKRYKYERCVGRYIR